MSERQNYKTKIFYKTAPFPMALKYLSGPLNLGQCYKTFFLRQKQNKLVCLSVEIFFRACLILGTMIQNIAQLPD